NRGWVRTRPRAIADRAARALPLMKAHASRLPNLGTVAPTPTAKPPALHGGASARDHQHPCGFDLEGHTLLPRDLGGAVWACAGSAPPSNLLLTEPSPIRPPGGFLVGGFLDGGVFAVGHCG